MPLQCTYKAKIVYAETRKRYHLKKKFFDQLCKKKTVLKAFFTNFKHFRPVKADSGSNIADMTLKICKNVVFVYANNV